MSQRSSPAHARDELEVLSSERIIASERWRARVGAEPAVTPVLERAPDTRLRDKLARGLRAPALAGIAVFVIAVIVAIAISVAGSLGGEPPAADAGANVSSAAVPRSSGAGSGPQELPAVGGDGSPRGSSEGVPAAIFVHVVGAVERPGVVELQSGARVQDAISAAGGATGAAVLAEVNLARQVDDGEQLLVPDAATAQQLRDGLIGAAPGGAGSSVAPSPGGAGPSTGSSAGDDSAFVNLNSADQAQLETLPRVGPALAQRIIEWRETNGGFTSVDQLLEVSGIGAKTLEGFRDMVAI